jgi:hypothetical protein
VRDREGRTFLVRDVTADAPEPNTIISENMLGTEPLTRVPEQVAIRGYITVVLSPTFYRILSECSGDSEIRWARLDSGMRFAYLPAADVRDWRHETASRLLSRVRQMLIEPISDGARTLRMAEEILRQVRYVTDRVSTGRERMYGYLALILAAIDPTRWLVVRDLAKRDLEIDDQTLDAVLRKHQQGMTRTGTVYRPPAIFGTDALKESRQRIGEIAAAC